MGVSPKFSSQLKFNLNFKNDMSPIAATDRPADIVKVGSGMKKVNIPKFNFDLLNKQQQNDDLNKGPLFNIVPNSAKFIQEHDLAYDSNPFDNLHTTMNEKHDQNPESRPTFGAMAPAADDNRFTITDINRKPSPDQHVNKSIPPINQLKLINEDGQPKNTFKNHRSNSQKPSPKAVQREISPDYIANNSGQQFKVCLEPTLSLEHGKHKAN